MSDQTTPQKKKKFALPIMLAVFGAFSIFMLFVTYGPRKRGLIETMLRPKDPLELYDLNGLTSSGKTLAVTFGCAAFVLIFYLVYNYVNKTKLKESDDIE